MCVSAKIGFTGSRTGLSSQQRTALLRVLMDLAPDKIEVHHGMCVGADQDFNSLVRNQYASEERLIVGHPPINNRYLGDMHVDVLRDVKEYMERNRDIVKETVLLIACPNAPERQRSGTWATVRFARSTNKRIITVWPDGRAIPEP